MPDSKFKLVGIGELLWDCFADKRKPGGAPANVSFHAQQLGIDAFIVSSLGTDELGDELCTFLQAHGLDTSFIQADPAHPTGTVTVEMVRADHPQYTIHEDVAWDHIAFDNKLQALCESADAICFGTLAQRSPNTRQTIRRCIDATKNCAAIYDVNLRPPYFDRETIEASLRACTVAKFNNEEAALLAEMLELRNTDLKELAAEMLAKYELDSVCITQGSDGCLIHNANETASAPCPPIKVADTVGAGDAFTASITLAHLNKWDAQTTARFANQIAASVASQHGAMPPPNKPFIHAQIAKARSVT